MHPTDAPGTAKHMVGEQTWEGHTLRCSLDRASHKWTRPWPPPAAKNLPSSDTAAASSAPLLTYRAPHPLSTAGWGHVSHQTNSKPSTICCQQAMLPAGRQQ